jgi:ribonuclease HI
MHANHKGGKKVLNLEARNKAIHLTWLKAYLNMDENRGTWTYFADALISKDIPDSQQIDQDPESRTMPILQTWQTKSKKSDLPTDLKEMLKLARVFNVQVSTPNPSLEVKLDLPIWYHIHSAPSTRRLYKTKHAKCLRKNHNIRLTRDVLSLINELNDDHIPAANCKCNACKNMRTTEKCPHPFKCLNLAATLLGKIDTKWNPLAERTATPSTPQNSSQQQEEATIIDRGNETTYLKDAITIFGDKNANPTDTPGTAQRTTNPPNRPTTVYADGACLNNGEENASAGLGVWYGKNDTRNLYMRVPIDEQSNQTGELLAELMAIKSHPPNEDLKIISDSRYVIDGLTKNRKRWEARDWIDTHHGNIFKCITAWTRWRNGNTYIKWIKGHSGVESNEKADRLASEGAKLTTKDPTFSLEFPQNLTTSGVRISDLEQKDFYRIINEKEKIPQRTWTNRNLELIKASAQETYGSNPTPEKIWLATKQRDLTRRARDFLWKSTQNAYKIGNFWLPIANYEERGTCPLCDELEDMEHILVKCKATNRATAWNLANELWEKRYTTPLPNRLGDILGCGLANFQTNGKPDVGKKQTIQNTNVRNSVPRMESEKREKN